MTAAAAVLVGTLFPLALEAVTAEKISVGAPFFDRTLGPLLLALTASHLHSPRIRCLRAV